MFIVVGRRGPRGCRFLRAKLPPGVLQIPYTRRLRRHAGTTDGSNCCRGGVRGVRGSRAGGRPRHSSQNAPACTGFMDDADDVLFEERRRLSHFSWNTFENTPWLSVSASGWLPTLRSSCFARRRPPADIPGRPRRNVAECPAPDPVTRSHRRRARLRSGSIRQARPPEPCDRRAGSRARVDRPEHRFPAARREEAHATRGGRGARGDSNPGVSCFRPMRRSFGPAGRFDASLPTAAKTR